MQTPLPYIPPPKGLLASLKRDVRALAHERLADTLRWYQARHALDDDAIARQMNACPNVIGIRGRKEDHAHAPISAAKVTRFKDRKTRPQSQTLAQMTAFFEHTLNVPPFLIWTDMDDVLAGLHDARRFRKERTRKDLMALTDCWLFCELQTPHVTMALKLSPLSAAPVIAVRGRIAMFEQISIILDNGVLEHHGMEGVKLDAFLSGYATLTPHNLNLYLRDAERRQVIICLDVQAGPFEQDSEETPYLFVRQATINLPPAFGASLPPIFRAARSIQSRRDYIAKLTDHNIYGQDGRPHGASFFSFGSFEWDALQRAAKQDDQIRKEYQNLTPGLSGLGLLTPSHPAEAFWRSVFDLKYLIERSEKAASA